MTTRNTEHLAATVAEHIKADAVFQDMYWDEEAQKGCFIGCLVHGNRPEIIEERYGIPMMITRIAEAIFERLPADEAKQFFADFPAAINNDGKDLSRVGWQFLAQTLRDLPVVAAEVQAVIDPVIAGLDRLAKGEEWPRAAAAARVAVWAAVWAADAAWAAAIRQQRDLLLRLIREA